MRFLKLFLALLLCLSLSSCARIWLQPTKKVIFESDTTLVLSYGGSDYQSKGGHKVIVDVERSPKGADMVVATDSLEQTVHLKSELENLYLYGNLFTYCVGYLVDINTPKKYGYPNKVWYDSKTNEFVNYKLYTRELIEAEARRKGLWNFDIGVPLINQFNHKSSIFHRHFDRGGFLGISLGLEYYYQHRRYVNLSCSFATDFMVPFPAPITFDGDRKSNATAYLSLTHNHRLLSLSKLSVGYGVALVHNRWSWNEFPINIHKLASKAGEEYRSPEDYYSHKNHYSNLNDEERYMENGLNRRDYEVDFKERYNALGVVGNILWLPNETFYAGVEYRPTFWRFSSPNRFSYNHFITVKFGFKVALNKNRLSPKL